MRWLAKITSVSKINNLHSSLRIWYDCCPCGSEAIVEKENCGAQEFNQPACKLQKLTFTYDRLSTQPLLAIESYEVLLEFEHYNLGIRPQPQRRSPRSCSTRSKDLHPPDPA
jgi:hypothetical protein